MFFLTCIHIQGNLIFPDLSFSTYSIKDSDHKNTFLHKLRLYLLISFLFCQISSGIMQLALHTGSTIRNWHKVKTWLDQMFWQIYQKLMLSGFLSSGNLCLINHLKLFWPHAASMASDRKVAKMKHEFSQFFWKIINFKTSK